VIPKREFAGAAVGRVTKSADFGLGRSFDASGAGNGEIMFGGENGIGQSRTRAKAKEE
jgi:hypothetical protein